MPVKKTSATRKKQPVPKSLKVLFIGNSFTARNNLPGLVAQIAAAAGAKLDHQLISVGGASLRTHWNKGDALKAIQQGGFDFVVLQEQSTLPIKNAQRMHENVRLFDRAIKAAGARTVLYLTWSRQHEPEAQDKINDAYQTIAREISALVIPAGIAWQTFMRSHKTPVLHDRDKSHPTLAGSYLAACTAFATLFQCSPEKLAVDIEGLTVQDMKLLQKTAADVTLRT
jgi:hypothetical protein